MSITSHSLKTRIRFSLQTWDRKYVGDYLFIRIKARGRWTPFVKKIHYPKNIREHIQARRAFVSDLLKGSGYKDSIKGFYGSGKQLTDEEEAILQEINKNAFS
jgi:hypothetical protein